MNKDEMKVYEKGYADGQAHAIDTMNYIFHDEGIKIRKETAREILQLIDSRLDICRTGIFERKIYFEKGYKMAIQVVKMLIKAEYGIEEEDKDND